MSSNEPRVFGELGEGEMFRHVDRGRTVGGVLRKEWHEGEEVGNAVVVATGERWVFHGDMLVVRYVPRTRAHHVLALTQAAHWPRKRQECQTCELRRRCRQLVRQHEMSICEVLVETMQMDDGSAMVSPRRYRRRGYHRAGLGDVVDRR